MQQNETQPSRARRAVEDLVLAEMFLVQATIESASAIGDGLGELGRTLSGEGESRRQAITDLLQRTGEEAIEPYTSRFHYLRKLRESED